MASLVKAFNLHPKFKTRVCFTAQNREMLDQVHDIFLNKQDYVSDLMKPNQNLNELTPDIITEVQLVLENHNPNFVYVDVDTTNSMTDSIASLYSGINVCHVEAGLQNIHRKSQQRQRNRFFLSSRAGLQIYRIVFLNVLR